MNPINMDSSNINLKHSLDRRHTRRLVDEQYINLQNEFEDLKRKVLSDMPALTMSVHGELLVVPKKKKFIKHTMKHFQEAKDYSYKYIANKMWNEKDCLQSEMFRIKVEEELQRIKVNAQRLKEKREAKKRLHSSTTADSDNSDYFDADED
jgi:hypothetical protein